MASSQNADTPHLPPQRWQPRKVVHSARFLDSFDLIYSAPIGDLTALRPFVCPWISCILGGSAGAVAKAFERAGYTMCGARSETGAGHRALGIAKETGRPAFVLTVGGAAGSALVQSMWGATEQGASLIAITGEIETALAGNGGVQDGTGRGRLSLTNVLSAVTCRSRIVYSAEEAWRELLICVGMSLAGHGNTHISIPSDIQRRLFLGGGR